MEYNTTLAQASQRVNKVNGRNHQKEEIQCHSKEPEQNSTPVMIEFLLARRREPARNGSALYKKNHDPILQRLIKEGILEKRDDVCSCGSTRRRRRGDPKIVMVWRDWAALEEADHRDPQIKRELYPDQEDLARKEDGAGS